jgi:transposase
MIRSDFLNSEQREELEQITRRPSEEHGVSRRANAILLLDDGFSCAQIAKVLYIDDDTVRTWHKHYMSGGFDELETFDWQGGKPYPSEVQAIELTDFLDRNLHRDTNQIRAHIRQTYAQFYSKSGCIKLLARLGFEYKKPKRIPAQADEAEQREFINDYENLLNSLRLDEAIYFVDAVHPEHQSKPAYGWIKKGEKIALKSSSGRRRVNIHGAVNLENFDCPFVEVETVNSDSTIALFKKIELRNPTKIAIYVFLDNAKYTWITLKPKNPGIIYPLYPYTRKPVPTFRVYGVYHHAKAVRAWLARTKSRIKPVFLPAYAPHLNPIELLWGVMHQYVTHNRFYPGFNEFAEAIIGFFEKTVPAQWRDFRDRVSDNFRIILHDKFRIL